MHPRKLIRGLLAGGLTVFLLSSAATPQERIFNSKGWNLPDAIKMPLEGVERIKLPGIPIDIIIETRYLGQGSEYYIKNPPWRVGKGIDSHTLINEQVMRLKTYRSPDGQVLCYWYNYGLGGPPSAAAVAAVASYICDLDGDGRNETRISPLGEPVEKESLLSIIRVKLGLSDEAGFIKNRLIRHSCG